MEGIKIASISIKDIDMEKCYFNPGCAYMTYMPERAERMQELLQKYFGSVKPHRLCCNHDPQLPTGSTIINNCAGCDRRFRSLYEGISTISLWEILDSIEDFPLPDYNGMEISVHDSCSFRPKPQVHKAVRSLLKKMNMIVVDAELSGQKSICCGDNFYPTLSEEEVIKLQKKRAAMMPKDDVAVYCVSCIKSMTIGGKRAHHMFDLVLGEPTVPGETRIGPYHKLVSDYIELH